MAIPYAQIKLTDAPCEIVLDEVMALPVTPLLVTGIVNPFGPTLDAVVVADHARSGTSLPVIRLMLNPFAQDAHVVGECVMGQKDGVASVIPGLFDLPYVSCPSLLLPNADLDEKNAISLHAEFLRRFEDAIDLLEQIRRHFGNPRDRVSADMDGALAQLSNSETEQPDGREGRFLTLEQAKALAMLLLSEQHAKRELMAFFQAWKGSLKHGPTGLNTMDFDTFLTVFEHLTASCRLPKAGR